MQAVVGQAQSTIYTIEMPGHGPDRDGHVVYDDAYVPRSILLLAGDCCFFE